MTSVLEQLHRDHINVAALLDFLELQILGTDAPEDLDVGLLREVMSYMTRYPDQFHHRHEDAVFDRLLQRDRAAAQLIQDLVDEHRVLAEHGAQMLEVLEALAGSPVRRDDLAASAQQYSEMLRAHMSKEEGRVFPLARLLLSWRDWEAIEAHIAQQDDPLFGRVVEHSYAALRRAIDATR